MIIEQLPGCCGVALVRGLRNDDVNRSRFFNAVRRHYSQRGHRKQNLFVFSDNIDYKNGTTIVDIIQKEKLGELTASPVATNPVHLNQTKVQVWCWLPNKRKVNAYCKSIPAYKAPRW